MATIIPDVSIIEVENESVLVDSSPTLEVITDTVEVATLEIDSGTVALIEVGMQGPQGPAASDVTYARRSEIVGNVVYRGNAALGSAEDAEVWKIWRMTFNYATETLETVHAGSGDFAHAWTNRLNLVYQ